jgi:mycothiol synthase
VNLRPATPTDFPAIADLFASVEEAVLGRPSQLDENTVEGWLQTIAFETNTWLFEEDGVPVAGAFGRLYVDRGNSAGAVKPSAQGRGLGARLVELVEGRLAEEGAARVHSWALAGDERATGLFGQSGYSEARRFWEMAIELDEEPPEPGAAIEEFREEDAQGFHAANEEAFEDHWEAQPESFPEWWSRQRSKSNFDPTLWFLIRDGEEIVALVRNEARGSGGYVGSLAVRRPWRGRGYGRALLLHSFREFRRRGMARATLGVDASNATGATHLYESVGMHVEQEEIVWEKLLA